MTKAIDQFHVGMVVDDLESARADLTELFGYAWCAPISVPTPVVLAAGETLMEITFTHSISTPRLESIKSVPRTPWTDQLISLASFDPVDQAPTQGRGGVDDRPRQRQPTGALAADAPRNRHSAACAGNKAHPDLGQTERRCRIGDHRRGKGGYLDPGPHAVSVKVTSHT